MATSKEVEILNKIFMEVDESEIKIIFSNQCSKAQASLLQKLKKKIKSDKGIRRLIADGNIKIEVEIKLAEQELNNLIIANDTIKSGNIEMRKELLLKIDENSEFSKRIEMGAKKYEELWLTSRRRFENIPLVQQSVEGRKRIQFIENNINNLRNKCLLLSNEITTRKRAARDLTQKYVIDLAQFLVKDRIEIMQKIRDRINEIRELSREVENLQQPEMSRRYSKVKIIELQDDSYQVLREEKKLDYKQDYAIAMPKLQLMDVDLDILGVKLNQIKKIDLTVTTQENKKKQLGYKMDLDNSSNYFNKWESLSQRKNNYSDRKLIHILGDIALESNQTMDIISKVDTNQLQNVNIIGSQQKELLQIYPSDEKVSKPLKVTDGEMDHNEQIAEQSPPQVLDRKKKKVSFDLSMDNAPCGDTENLNTLVNKGQSDETLKCQDVSLDSDGGCDKIKDKIQEHKLDSSPEFIYAKHVISNKVTEEVLTSKFFDTKNTKADPNASDTTAKQETKIQENFTIPSNMDMYKNKTFDPSTSKITQDVQKMKFPLSGLLFEHGSQAIPDLNISLNATGCDGDDSYPQCFDSSVLLSPKADESSDAANNNTVMPQGVPNFMSGVRKTGSSFFERLSNDPKPDTSNANAEGNFNFNFDGEEKKNRGFFRMFF